MELKNQLINHRSIYTTTSMSWDIKDKVWIEYFGPLGRLVARIRLNIITKLEVKKNIL